MSMSIYPSAIFHYQFYNMLLYVEVLYFFLRHTCNRLYPSYSGLQPDRVKKRIRRVYTE